MTTGRIAPGATLGVMGGGQLGRMFVNAAQRLGYFTAVLDPDPASPAGLVSHHHVEQPYLSEGGLAQLMQLSAAITTEFENVPAAALLTLGAHRPVSPAADAVAICQDRAEEKAHFARSGVPCAPYLPIEAPAQLASPDVDTLLPGILKTSTLGYDGKGQVAVSSRAQLGAAWEALKRVPCVLEKRLPLQAELSVVVARDAAGTTVHLPVQRNQHRDGILALTTVPSGLPEEIERQAVDCARRIADSMSYVGVLCVEFFLLDGGRLVANEMAPRPHNSGHYSIDACDCSQFELQVRTTAGLPLVQPRLHSAAVMLNLLGDLWFLRRDGDAEFTADEAKHGRTPAWESVLQLPGAHLHLYGKLSARPGRKMGHLTITAATAEAALQTAREAASRLGLPLPAPR